MSVLRADVALIDIEGTVGSIAFVRDTLFPYAKERLDEYVALHANEPGMRALLDDAAREAGAAAHDLPAILRALHAWSDEDRKVTALKAIQGRIWQEGFASGGIRGHLYDDAVHALQRFHTNGVLLYVYSSGSVPAQKQLFRHSSAGDLLPLFSGFFDTTIGGKRNAASYARIASEIAVQTERIVFFSDNAAELHAARDAGMQTVQLARPQDGTEPNPSHRSETSFDAVEVLPT